ncbi:MAG: family 20 glycosylhydrolase [Muribaculaceae bacterium]
MKHLLLAIILMLSTGMQAQMQELDALGLSLIPAPKECQVTSTKLHPIKQIRTVKHATPRGADEYGITSRRGKVTIWGNTVWARQTLAQLTDAGGRVPDVDIHDWASYPIRGFMHDTGRNFQTIDMLKATIDMMSRYRLNVFHWHLTDRPSWRIESYCYPQLNDPQYQRRGRDEGKFYTYDEIRQLFDYAAQRGITIMPEIDMPGHSESFTAAMGFKMHTQQGIEALSRCLDEFFKEIPAEICPYIHVGSDEVHVPDPEGFASWAQGYVTSRGRKAMVWDPGLPVMPGTIRQIWNGGTESNAKAVARPERYVDSFVGYLNYYDPVLFTMRAWQHRACAQAEPDTTRALGGILCLWNDVRVDDKTRISLHNGMANGMMAFAERFWNGGAGASSMPDENLYPDPSTPEGKALAQFEQRLANHRDRFFDPSDIRWVANSHIAWDIAIGNTTVKAWGGAIDLDVLCQTNNLKPNEQRYAVATTTITVPQDTVITAWLGFDTPARSDRMATGIGQQFRWENDGLITVNGTAVWPSQPWKQPCAYCYPYHTWGRAQEEEPFTDEQLYWMRQPAKLQLKRGVNHITITVPHAFNNQRWGFAFIPMSVNEKGMAVEAGI